MENLIAIVLVLLIIILLYGSLMSKFNFWKKRGINGPRATSLFGNVPGIFTFSHHMIYDFDRIYHQYKMQERCVGLFIGLQPRLLIIEPSLIQEILISNFKNFQDNDTILTVDTKKEEIMNQNPFFLPGTEWRNKRLEMSPAFSNSKIKANYSIMKAVSKKLSEYIENELEGSNVHGINARELAARYTTEVVSNAVYGIDAGAFSQEKCRIRDVGLQVFKTNNMKEIFYIFVLSSIPILNRLFSYRLISENAGKFFTNLLQNAISIRSETKEDRVDFLNYLLQLKEKRNITHNEMVSYTLAFFLDGLETSSIFISHVLHMLAKNKDVQQKLRKEIKENISEDGFLTFENLNDLPYLECVINETLRLYPAVFLLGKICTESHEIANKKGEKLLIEKDMKAIIPIYSIHRDPEYYENPDEFIPERFSEENGGVKKYKDMGVFLPFGNGPRICIGMRFALAQTKAAIAELTLNWDMTLNNKTKAVFKADPRNFILVADGGVWINFKKLNGHLKVKT